MDIARHVSAVARRGSLIAAIAAVAGAVTVAIAAIQPQQYRATADVVVPVPDTIGSRIVAVSQRVSDFEGALHSLVVAQRVAAQTGLPPDDIQSGLAAEQLGGGGVVEVTFVSPDLAASRTVVEIASSQALRILMQGELVPISHLYDSTVDAREQAEEDFRNFQLLNDIGDPERYFIQQQKQLRALEADAAALRQEGEDEDADALDALVAERVADLAPKQVEFRVVSQTLAAAVDAEREANAQLVRAQAALTAVQDPDAIPVSDPVPVSRIGQILRRLLVAVVVATALAIGLVILLELTTAPAARPRAVPSGRGRPVPHPGVDDGGQRSVRAIKRGDRD